ncbi:MULTISPECIES: hypothetical protein [Leptolyngbya]|jgi:hypothetical protein|nr:MULTISPECIES: hypothetical protein [Leptolyngbya]MBD2368826.1 hypothetical protein [Leptolyngbya sp. FACHB-161]MBD2375306.1 hypothetical protein [Leptolyngbya sp. FACHB-238]MBD2399724.1 hypothetical protein [Leptolyngbya sp. FACHB-239]MBD2405930.1 hypothetical protein [Leptolyngbya sp. FACHB-402]ULP32750.1 hypothetical protein MCP04_13445 [Leptolyngbya boryana IU 594]
MKLLPNLSKVPVWMSLSMIVSSPLLAYLLASRPVDSLTMDDVSPGTLINKIAQSANPETLPVPAPAPVGRYEESQSGSPCFPPPQVTQPRYQLRATDTTSAPVARRPTGSYWDKNASPQSYEAKVLLNVAPGTTRKAIASKLGDMGNYSGTTATYATADGTIQINFNPKPRLLDDTVEWVGFVQ